MPYKCAFIGHFLSYDLLSFYSLKSLPITIVTCTLLLRFLLFDMLPVPSAVFISFTVSSSSSFLFVIMVLDICDVFPVFVTSYPFSFRMSTACCSLALSPLPFSTSIFISDFANFVFVVLFAVLFFVLLVEFTVVLLIVLAVFSSCSFSVSG